ncbi:hypothetical protein ACFL1I_04730, partial [Candidatus Omnitrophota bacterium]
GTRRYNWGKELRIYGTDNRLEHLRDFKIVDIDKILRRQEDTKTWIFPEFTEDVFKKRFVYSKLIKDSYESGSLVAKVFGKKYEPKEKIRHYLRNNKNPDTVISIEKYWSVKWKKFLRALFRKAPLEAMLAAAWARQSGINGSPESRLELLPPKNKPWNKVYWRKERIQQALMQIASRSKQRMLWAGRDDIIGSSSGNISIFLSICYEVWETFLRTESKKNTKKKSNSLLGGMPIDSMVQAMAIHNASCVWYQKITEQPDGDDRQNFVDFLGNQFKRWLDSDTSMSYPGHNGFSIASELFDAFKECQELKNFLDDAVDYGVLYDMPHTTKKNDRKGRTKWYLVPILSPHFQIPHQHIKEPYYLENISELYEWVVEKSKVCPILRTKKYLFSNRVKKPDNAYVQPSLFERPKKGNHE